jgi:hypothetical protein
MTKSSNNYFSRCYKGVAPYSEKSNWDPSSILMEQMDGNPIDFTDLNDDEKVCWIYKFQLDLHFLEKAGWVSHTCDWDPFLVITLMTGQVWETESGYYDIELKGLKDGNIDELDSVIVMVTSCDDTSDNEFVREIPLSTIKSICIINQ